jgi:2-C-methyl-D-erythritol 4-phosphate cytidylyltransferase
VYEGRKTFAIIPAAGSGSRMGLPHSKLLCKNQGQELLLKTLIALSQNPWCDCFVIACRDVDRLHFADILKDLRLPIEFVEGGESRQHSVKNALNFIKLKLAPASDSLVLVHDAARCFVSAKLIDTCLATALDRHAVTAAVSCIDTVYAVDSAEKLQTPVLERKSLRAIQTPQVFKFDLLVKAHAEASIFASDDAGLVAQIANVYCVEGDAKNIKITVPSDLEK